MRKPPHLTCKYQYVLNVHVLDVVTPSAETAVTVTVYKSFGWVATVGVYAFEIELVFVTVPKFVVAPFGFFTLIEIDETVWLVRAVSVICVFFAIGASKVGIIYVRT